MKIIFYETHDPQNGVEYQVPYTVSVSSFLDEELDNTAVELTKIERAEPFKPFAIAEFKPTEEESIYWLVASDSSVKDIATGRYTHTVQLIEPTKWLERWMVGNKAVSHPISEKVSKASGVTFDFDKQYQGSGLFEIDSYTTPTTSDKIAIYSPLAEEKLSALISQGGLDIRAFSGYFWAEIEYADGNAKRITINYGTGKNFEIIRNDFNVAVSDPYSEVLLYEDSIGPWCVIKYLIDFGPSYPLAIGNMILTGLYSVGFASNSQNSTYSTVVNNFAKTAQNLLEGEAGVFVLDSSSIPPDDCPEIVVSNATLREALDEIGKTFGAISRLDIYKSGGKFAYKIGFEKFCKDEIAALPDLPGEVIYSQSCEDYCTVLDATVDNLVQYADGGTIIDPAVDAFRTLRSEDASYRVTEGNCEILTEFPIERLDHLWVSIKGIDSGETRTLDIAKYCYESAEYSLLSSYLASYPYSKAYALEYSIGSRAIRGLSFEMEDALSELLRQPAIVNIINREFGTSFNDGTPLDFTRLLFRVEYVPTGSARVRMWKPWSYGMHESVLPFNQSAAKLDSSAFGRSMFGNVIRMGNVQAAYIFTLPLSYSLPERGCRIGEDGYLAEVKTEYGPASKKVTFTVVQGFNRLSAYVGVNQTLRLFEISERMSLDRHLIVEDFCSIGTEQTDLERPTSVKDNLIAVFESLFYYSDAPNPARIVAKATGYTGRKNLGSVLKPCLTYALGNAIAITFCYHDNFAAGRRINRISYQDEFFKTMTDVPYADAFGRIDLLEVDFMRGVPSRVFSSESDQIANDMAIANALPAVDGETLNELAADYFARFTKGSNAIVVNKDSREAIKGVTYQINIMERDGVKVSPTLAECTGFGSQGHNLFLVLLNKPINNLTQTVSNDDMIGGTRYSATHTASTPNGFSVTFDGLTSGLSSMLAWAVIDDKGRFCFGKNERLTDSSLTVYFSFYH